MLHVRADFDLVYLNLIHQVCAHYSEDNQREVIPLK